MNKELFNKYKEVILTFQTYNRFQFTFTGIAKDGNMITVCHKVCADDIHRVYIDAKNGYPLSDFCGDDSTISVKRTLTDEQEMEMCGVTEEMIK